MIKYLGSKRVLVPVLGAICSAVEARTTVDFFTGTTRVAQEFKRRGAHVTAIDSATYAEVLARCYVATDARTVDATQLQAALDDLNALPGRYGYFTRVFCEESRYLQPHNGMRVDAIRDALDERYRDTAIYPILLTALLLAADRVDSTTGLQMAYLKRWSPRSHRALELRPPDLLAGPGCSVLGDATALAGALPRMDLAYLDPPYNQHSYRGNYHVWETLVRWDSPAHYGVACKRADVRDAATKSVFNSKRSMPAALRRLITDVSADVVVVSYNDESWVTADELMDWLAEAGHERVSMLAFDAKRYVGAQIGIHSPAGRKVGQVSHLRNTEYVFVAGPSAKVDAAMAAVATDGGVSERRGAGAAATS